jgi:hypothetical protein
MILRPTLKRLGLALIPAAAVTALVSPPAGIGCVALVALLLSVSRRCGR